MRKTIHEIIDETVEFYSNNPRSLVVEDDEEDDHLRQTRCLYNGPNGTKCAFARLVKDEFVHLLPEESCCVVNYALICPMEHLKEEYQNHPPGFYRQLQILHDASSNWVELGDGTRKLSDRGIELVDSMKTKFNS